MNNYLSFGARELTCQLPRIDAGLSELGWSIGPNPVFIYSNDQGFYDDAIKAKIQYSKSKLILNVLDIPEHLNNLPQILSRYREYLERADIITCISNTVKGQIKKYLKLDSHVIYNPAKEITPLNLHKDIDVLMTGRVNDPNKRVSLAYDLWSKRDIKIHFAGSEYTGFGQYHGLVDDKLLNRLYNRAKYVFAFGKVEGIGLQIPEAILANNTVPIALSDCPASCEFCPSEFLAQPNLNSIIETIQWCERNPVSVQTVLSKYRNIYKTQFNKRTIAQNIINVANL